MRLDIPATVPLRRLLPRRPARDRESGLRCRSWVAPVQATPHSGDWRLCLPPIAGAGAQAARVAAAVAHWEPAPLPELVQPVRVPLPAFEPALVPQRLQ